MALTGDRRTALVFETMNSSIESGGHPLYVLPWNANESLMQIASVLRYFRDKEEQGDLKMQS